MAKARVETVNGSPAIVIDGQVMPPMFATIRTSKYDSMAVDAEYYRRLGESGIKLYFLICDTEWLKPGAYALFAEEAEILLREVPDAYIMLRIGMHPPVTWCEENPSETVSYSDGKRKAAHLHSESFIADYPAMYSFCSKKWQSDATEALLDTLEEIRRSPYGERVIGCFFAAGGTSEWYYITPTEYTEASDYCDSGGWIQTRDTDYPGVYADLSPAFRAEFSAYLKAKYKDDDGLRRAWNQADVTLDDPRIPDCDDRYIIYGVDYDLKYPSSTYSMAPVPDMPTNGGNIGQFLDLTRRRDVYDFFRAWHLGTAKAVIAFGQAVKAYDGNLLTGAFYGSAGSTKFWGFGQIGSVDAILRSGVIDLLASPGVYENREPGGFTGQRQNFDSFRLKNTLFVVEDDVRTHLENHANRSRFELYSFADTANVMKREFGRNICEDTQSWWFDQIIGGGRYKDEAIYRLIARQQEIAREAYSLDRRKASEVALIYDEESYHVVSDMTNIQLVELFRNYEVDRVGLPCDRYLHNDMADPNMPDYKLYVFFNTICLTDAERREIRAKLARNHATALFLYGAGMIDPDSPEPFSPLHAERLTGIQMARLDGVFSGKYKLCSRHPITNGLHDDEIYGGFGRKMKFNVSGYEGKVREIDSNLLPLLYADDPKAESIAYFPDSGKPAMAMKDNGEFCAIYLGSKCLDSAVLRSIARFAGCHIYTDSDDVLYANRSYITFHASSGGEKTIRLPRVSTAVELYESKEYASCAKEIVFTARRGETKMFRLQSKESEKQGV